MKLMKRVLSLMLVLVLIGTSGIIPVKASGLSGEDEGMKNETNLEDITGAEDIETDDTATDDSITDDSVTDDSVTDDSVTDDSVTDDITGKQNSDVSDITENEDLVDSDETDKKSATEDIQSQEEETGNGNVTGNVLGGGYFFFR